MEAAALQAAAEAQNTKSLKTLKPHLEQRYEEHRFDNPFEAFEVVFNSSH